MPIYQLSDTLVFPPAELAEPKGLLAVGGDLSEERLLLAYKNGIFPWYSKSDPILWWSPDPRMIIIPNKFHLSRRLKRTINNSDFIIKADTAFEEVIKKCAKTPRKEETGTWILKNIINAYTKLHALGYAHSIEVWKNNKLVGGLYGVAIGKAFFGESMFSLESNTSKMAFYTLSKKLAEWEYLFIDCQFWTQHLEKLGGYEIPRKEYLKLLDKSNRFKTNNKKWTEYF